MRIGTWIIYQQSPDLEMMAHSMDLGEKIGKVPHSRLPGNSELTLPNTLSDPA
jgi:hypothetical protein